MRKRLFLLHSQLETNDDNNVELHGTIKEDAWLTGAAMQGAGRAQQPRADSEGQKNAEHERSGGKDACSMDGSI